MKEPKAMKTWNSIKKVKPLFNAGVMLLIISNESFNIVTGHYGEDKLFYVYDLFDEKFKVVPDNWKVTRWKALSFCDAK